MNKCLPLRGDSLIQRMRIMLLLVFLSGLFACTTTRELKYFDGLEKQTMKGLPEIPEPVIQRNDLLSITVSSMNAAASAIFNAPNESTPTTNQATAYGNTLTVGYLVNPNGDIQFPVLGTIHVEGMTKSQLHEYLTKQLTEKKLLVDPILTIRYLNFRVSVIGEVTRPGVYTSPSEKFSMLEALGMAGDITLYGKRDNVLVIREDGRGTKSFQRINLNTQELLKSPYYYLHSNDIIYVEPSKEKVNKERNAVLVPIFLSLTTLAIVIIDRIGN